MYARAAELYALAAAQGHVSAQCCLGSMYLNGNGTVKDYGNFKAVELY